jgi:hypothetical protein
MGHSVMIVSVVNHSLLETGESMAAFGFGVALLYTVLGSQYMRPRKQGYAMGRWQIGRMVRIPLALLGVAGLLVMLIAAL